MSSLFFFFIFFSYGCSVLQISEDEVDGLNHHLLNLLVRIVSAGHCDGTEAENRNNKQTKRNNKNKKFRFQIPNPRIKQSGKKTAAVLTKWTKNDNGKINYLFKKIKISN